MLHPSGTTVPPSMKTIKIGATHNVSEEMGAPAKPFRMTWMH